MTVFNELTEFYKVCLQGKSILLVCSLPFYIQFPLHVYSYIRLSFSQFLMAHLFFISNVGYHRLPSNITKRYQLTPFQFEKVIVNHHRFIARNVAKFILYLLTKPPWIDRVYLQLRPHSTNQSTHVMLQFKTENIRHKISIHDCKTCHTVYLQFTYACIKYLWQP